MKRLATGSCVARWVPTGESDVPAMEGGPDHISSLQHPGLLNRMQKRFWTGPAHPVDRVLRDGDEVGGFAVFDVPGHSAGHVAYWRERDRVLILGDVVNTMSLLTTRPGIREPPEVFTPDPVSSRRAINSTRWRSISSSSARSFSRSGVSVMPSL